MQIRLPARAHPGSTERWMAIPRIADSQGAEIDVSQGRVRIAGAASLLAVLDAVVDAVTPIAAAAGAPWPAAALKAQARQALR